MTSRLKEQEGNLGAWAIGSRGSALLLSHWADRDAERAAEAAEPRPQRPVDLNSIYPAERRGYELLVSSGDVGTARAARLDLYRADEEDRAGLRTALPVMVSVLRSLQGCRFAGAYIDTVGNAAALTGWDSIDQAQSALDMLKPSPEIGVLLETVYPATTVIYEAS